MPELPEVEAVCRRLEPYFSHQQITRVELRRPDLRSPSGAPRDSAGRLVRAIKRVLAQAIDRQVRDYRSSRFRVYDREGDRCLRARCGGTVARRLQSRAFERERIRQALDQTNWNVSAAARLLETERTALHKRIRALGLKRQ